MGRILVGVLILMSVGFSTAFAATKQVYISINDVFVPDELKSTGEAYIVTSGMFPNSCYSWLGGETKNKSQTEHEIRLMANVAQNVMCLMVLVPFSKEVKLGRLSPGEHTLRFINGDDTYFERTLTVK